MKWIKATDRLPDEGGDYIVYRKGDGYSFSTDAFYDDDDEQFLLMESEGVKGVFEDVTHWMYFPGPPAE